MDTISNIKIIKKENNVGILINNQEIWMDYKTFNKLKEVIKKDNQSN